MIRRRREFGSRNCNGRTPESVSQLFFRSSGACSFSTFDPQLALWALFWRRFAANSGEPHHLFRRAWVATQTRSSSIAAPEVVAGSVSAQNPELLALPEIVQARLPS